MILTHEQLEQYVDAQVYADRFVPLHVGSIIEFRSGLEISERGFDCGVEVEVEQYRDEYRIDAGVYRFHFEEHGEFPSYMVPMILPSSNALSVGTVAATRYASDGDLWTLVNVNRNTNIKEDAVVALLMVFDPGAIDKQVESTSRQDTPKFEGEEMTNVQEE